MSKYVDALEKIDHTICLNNLSNKIEWNIDKEDNCDCKSIEDFVDCYDIIIKGLNALEIIKKKNINIGRFILEVGKSGYAFETYKKYWKVWGYSPFVQGNAVDEKRLTNKEWNLLKEVLL